MEMVKLLLPNGVNHQNIRNSKDTPLQRAVRSNKEDLVELLLSHGAVAHYSEDVLFQALKNNNKSMVEMLLNSGVSLELKSGGETVLFAAVREELLEMVYILLEAGCDMETRDTRGRTPLMMAAITGNADIAKALIYYGAAIESDNNGRTALHEVAAAKTRYNWSLLQLLINEGADLEIEDESGNTPLMLAEKNKNRSAIYIIEDSPIYRKRIATNLDLFKKLSVMQQEFLDFEKKWLAGEIV